MSFNHFCRKLPSQAIYLAMVINPTCVELRQCAILLIWNRKEVYHMSDQGELRLMIGRFQEDIQARENELNAKKEKLTVLLNALGILENEGSLPQEKIPFENIDNSTAISNKYEGKALNESILDILENRHGIAVTSREIYNDLMAKGYTSGSKNKYRDVLVGLNRITKKGKILQIKEGNLRKYKLVQDNLVIKEGE
jgi:hypothetical protein